MARPWRWIYWWKKKPAGASSSNGRSFGSFGGIHAAAKSKSKWTRGHQGFQRLLSAKIGIFDGKNISKFLKTVCL